MASKDEEQILVVPRAALMPDAVHGFRPGPAQEFVERVQTHGVFRRRGDVEQDPSIKQIIPYLMVRHGIRIFVFQRSASGGEARLHGKYSIGVGGHINRSDDVEGNADFLEAGLRRELEEELVLDARWRPRLVGVLNDDTNPVGAVHFGLVHVVEVDSPYIAVRESDTLSGRLADSDAVRGLYERMETWSQLILDAADPTRL